MKKNNNQNLNINQWSRRVQIIQAIYSDLIYGYQPKNYEKRVYEFETWNLWQKNVLNLYFEKKNFFVKEIIKLLTNVWKIERISLINQAIILEAMAEFDIHKTSFKILIQQAVITAKKYCDSDQDYKFINGILDCYFKGL